MRIYRCIIILMIMTLTGVGGDDRQANVPVSKRSLLPAGTSGVGKAVAIKVTDLQKFYIGFRGVLDDKHLITLDITPLDSLDNEIRFHYIMNSIDAREDGKGKLYVDLGIVEFNNLFAGKFYRSGDRKIVFESLQENTSTYWKMKEK